MSLLTKNVILIPNKLLEINLRQTYSVDIDLSKELQPPPKPVLEYQVEAARRGISNVEVRSLYFSCKFSREFHLLLQYIHSYIR